MISDTLIVTMANRKMSLSMPMRSLQTSRLSHLFPLSCRCFAYGTNWKNAPRKRKPGKKAKALHPTIHLPPPQQPPPVALDRKSTIVPPALLVPTASPHVYISLHAVQKQDLDPRELFDVDSDNLRQLRPRCRYYGTIGPDAAAVEPAAASEVAVLGRSNVGKSSLINALTGHAFQRVSKQPGRTQHPHFLECCPRSSVARGGSGGGGGSGPVLGYLMDLPGYGYGVGPEAAVDAWQRRTQQALLRRRDRGSLRRVYLLVDGRHGPTPLDSSIMTWLEEADLPFTVTMTKSDAVSLPMLVKHVNQVCMRYHHEALSARQGQGQAALMISPLVHVTSAKKRTGLVELWTSILCEFRREE